MFIKPPRLPAVYATATNALKLTEILWDMLAIGVVFVITRGSDEAWMLKACGVRFGRKCPTSAELIVTSDDAFTLANLAVE